MPANDRFRSVRTSEPRTDHFQWARLEIYSAAICRRARRAVRKRTARGAVVPIIGDAVGLQNEIRHLNATAVMDI